VKGGARVPIIQVCSHAFYAGGAMIDAPQADRFNPNKEIGFDSP
jgi:hypothetical protein